jgi:hypothetical protein
MTNVTQASADIDDGGVSLGVEGDDISFVCRSADRSISIRPETTNFYDCAYSMAGNKASNEQLGVQFTSSGDPSDLDLG